MRTFFAIDLTPECKRQLQKMMDALQPYLASHFKGSPFRWVKPENLHLTLQFIGRLREADLTPLLLTVQKQLAAQKSFYLKLGALEWFPSMNHPHVLSLQTDAQEQLATMAKEIGEVLNKMGYPVEERSFRGHVTLARLDNIQNVSTDFLAAFEKMELPEVWVKEVVFFRSETKDSSTTYTKLAAIELHL